MTASGSEVCRENSLLRVYGCGTALLVLALLGGCRAEPEPGPLVARFVALGQEDEVIGEASLHLALDRPELLLERAAIQDEKSGSALAIRSTLETGERTRYRARRRFRRGIEEVEAEHSVGTMRWRKKRGLAIHRSESAVDDPLLLSWMVAIDDGPSGSMVLWHHLAGRLAATEPKELALSAFNICRGRSFELFVSWREKRAVTVGGEARRGSRLFVSTRASGHTVWLDADSGDLLSVDDVLSARMLREGFVLPEREVETAPSALVEEEITVRREDVELAGTLTFPRDRDGPVPVVILVHGSGPMDRDQSPFMVFRHLAHDLGVAGLAVLRYDKRGVKESRFLGDDRDVTLGAFAADARAWLDVLEERPEIDFRRISMAGHSEGAYIAPLVATLDSRVSRVVMLAGPVDPLLDILVEQAHLVGEAHGMTEEEVDEMLRSQDAMLRRVRSDVDPDPEDAEAITWLRSHYRHDPEAVLREIDVPVLAVYAEGDIQVPPTQADRLREIGEKREAGLFRIEMLDGLDHVLMDDRRGRSGVGLLSDPDRRLDPRVPALIAEFVEE